MSGETSAMLAAALCIGAAAGCVFFASLRRTLDLWLAGATARAVALLLLRFTLITALLAAAAMAGAAPLLAVLAGVLLARHAVLRRVRA